MRENIQFHPERERIGRLSRGGSGRGTAGRVRMYVLPPPRTPVVIEYSIGFAKAGRGAVARRRGMARMRRSTGHTPIFDPRQKLRGGSIHRQRGGFPTVVNPLRAGRCLAAAACDPLSAFRSAKLPKSHHPRFAGNYRLYLCLRRRPTRAATVCGGVTFRWNTGDSQRVTGC